MPGPVKIHSAHNAALSLWQSAVHSVLLKEKTDSDHAGIGATASDPHMVAVAEVAKQFDDTGTFQVTAPGPNLFISRSTGNVAAQAQIAGAPPAALQCAKIAAQIALYSVTNPERVQALRNELTASSCDPLWAECLAVYDKLVLSGQGQKYIGYESIDQFVIEECFPDTATVAIIGDWGTGMNSALVLLQQIEANFQPDVLIHLGDIYYSGLPSECANHFTKLIDQVWPPDSAKSAPLIFTLDGNHDRYAGCQGGYYDLIANLNKSSGKPQPNSYFAIRNNFWQFVALDTGYYDSNPHNVNENVTKLHPEEVAWHIDKIKNNGQNVNRAANPTAQRGTILLSHHQLFSFAGVGKDDRHRPLAVNPNLTAAFGPVFDQIDCWLWGHEHNLCIFEPYSNGPDRPLPKGRCIGASAVPIYLSQAPKSPADLLIPEGETGPPKTVPGTTLGNNGTVFNYCYAIMSLNGPTLSLDYYQLNSTDAKAGAPPKLGEAVYREQLQRSAAGNI